MNKWRQSTWGDEISLEYGKSLRDYSQNKGPVRVYGSNGPIGYHNTALSDGPGVILGRKGAYRGVEYSEGPFFVIDTAYYVVPKTELDMRWLYYAIKYHKLGEIDDGSPIPSTTRSAVYVKELDVPDILEQKSIAKALEIFDKKIELNQRMNETLESMAQAIFKSWFVDFDPVKAKAEGHNPEGMNATAAALFPSRLTDAGLPEGWHTAEIGDCCDVIDCLHSKKPERIDEGFPFLQLNNIRDDGLLDMTYTYFISGSDYKKWTSRIEAQEGDCVITNVGRVGAVAQIPRGLRAALGRNMTAIRVKNSFPYPAFLICCLTSSYMRKEIVLKEDAGTILSALNVRNIPKLRFIKAQSPIFDLFEAIVKPLREKMEENLKEISILSQLRDALLPRLISGNLAISEEDA